MPRARANPALNFVITDRYDPAESAWTYIWCPVHHFENLAKGDVKACGCDPGPQVRALRSTADDIGLGGARGGSKAQPLTAKVLTPKGWVEMGDVKVGMNVTDPTTGGQSSIVAVHERGEQEVYRVTFDDGATTEVGEDHLWVFKLPNHHRPRTKPSLQGTYSAAELGVQPLNERWNTLRVDTTTRLLAAFRKGFKPRIPLTRPVMYTLNGVSGTGPVPPYLIGLFLGDGCSQPKQLSFTSCDDEIRLYLLSQGLMTRSSDRVHADGKPMVFHAKGAVMKRISSWLRDNGLYCKHSWEKFVPKYVFGKSIEYRLELLRGLMDSDGFSDKRGRCFFSCTSKQLTEDVRSLVWSLGGKCFWTEHTPSFRHKGEKKIGRRAYKVEIQIQKTSALFKLTRKKVRCRDSWNGGYEIMRAVKSIEKVGCKKTRCITVSSPYGLYVTDDFIVTHNSSTGLAFFLKGNPEEPIHDHPKTNAQRLIIEKEHRDAIERLGFCPWCVNSSYIHHPGYVGLALRRSEKDMAYWLNEARRLYSKVGGVVTEKPARVTFQSGAVIYVGHLDGPWDSEKYQGPSYTRVLWEELEQIASEQHYRDIYASTRTKYGCYKGCEKGKCLCGKLVTQTMSTFNPGGKGGAWIKRMFVAPSPPNVKFSSPHDGKTRIFIPSRVEDNPYLMRDGVYLRELEALKHTDPVKYRQWRWGDWDAMAGSFFAHFRPNGPLKDTDPPEPEEARHVIPESEARISPWWPIFAGYDWGFRHESAILGFRQNPATKQVYATRELVLKGVGTVESGVQLALLFLEDLRQMEKCGGRPEMNVWLSPDAFGQRDATYTHAEFIQQGIDRVLGPGSCVLFWPDGRVAARDATFDDAQSRMRITLRHAQNARIAGAQYLREMLRWQRVEPLRQEDFNAAYYAELLNDDTERAYRYQAAFARSEPEALPKFIILAERCPQLIKAIPELQYAPIDQVTKANVEDVMKTDEISDQLYDAWRYGLHSQEVAREREPKQSYVEGRLRAAEARNLSMNDKIWIAREAAEKYDREMSPDWGALRPASSRWWKQ